MRNPAMPSMPTINLASVAFGLDRYLAERGVDPRQALRRAKLGPDDLSSPDARVPLVSYLELLEVCAEMLDDAQFGLNFGAGYDPRHAGVVGNVALACSTVREALATFGRYLPTMVDSVEFGVERDGSAVFVFQYYLDPLLRSYQQKTDWTIAFLCNLMRHCLGDPAWVPIEAVFPHLPAETADAHRARAAIVGGAIRGGEARSGIRFPAALLERPLVTADGMLERLMRHYGDMRLAALSSRRDDMQQLRREVARLLFRGDSSLARLAASTAMSTRTLQRRLNAAGVSYSALINDVRKTLALNLLENRSLALSEVAFSLGYSDLSAFNHAFRRWLGCSPGEYRGRAQAAR